MRSKVVISLTNLPLILIILSVCLGACSALPAIRERAVSKPISASPTASIEHAILYRGDAGRQGLYYEPAPRTFGGVSWRKSFDEDAYFPMYANGMLSIGTSSGKLLALDPASGQERWAFAAETGPILPVAVSDGLIYFGAGDKRFYAVEAQTRNLAWFFETDSSIWSASPLIMGGKVYFGSYRGTIYCLDLQTHQVAWTFKAASGVLSQIAGDEARIYVPIETFL